MTDNDKEKLRIYKLGGLEVHEGDKIKFKLSSDRVYREGTIISVGNGYLVYQNGSKHMVSLRYLRELEVIENAETKKET
jgi:hypothetical protein